MNVGSLEELRAILVEPVDYDAIAYELLVIENEGHQEKNPDWNRRLQIHAVRALVMELGVKSAYNAAAEIYQQRFHPEFDVRQLENGRVRLDNLDRDTLGLLKEILSERALMYRRGVEMQKSKNTYYFDALSLQEMAQNMRNIETWERIAGYIENQLLPYIETLIGSLPPNVLSMRTRTVR